MSNAFDLSGPSVVAPPLRRGHCSNTGKTRSQVATEVIIRKTAATGKNPGTIIGLRPEDKKSQKGRAPGHFRG